MLQLIGVLVSFILIILLIRYKINFGFALIIGSLILAIFSINDFDINNIPINMIQDQEFLIGTLELAILMTLIYMLAKLMQETNAISKLIDSLRTIFSKGGTLGVIPAIYGLMPVLGGALFSAPFVQEEGKEFNIQVDKKNFFNIWFRHIWFPVYPISITILTMAEYASIKVTDLIKGNFLTFLVMIIIGYIILHFFIKKSNDKSDLKKIDFECIKKECRGLIFLLPPIIPVSFVVFHYLFKISLEICFIFGVIFGIIILLYLVKIPKSNYFNLFKKCITWKFALVIIGIMVFRKIFELTKSNQPIFEMLQGFNIPILAILIILPFILGIVTGYLLIAITLSYPLLTDFFSITGLTDIGFASLIFMSAFVGYLISPIHLCNILSSNYLKTETTKMYPVFIPASIVLLFIHILIVLSLF
jgi:hypothetical protein